MATNFPRTTYRLPDSVPINIYAKDKVTVDNLAPFTIQGRGYSRVVYENLQRYSDAVMKDDLQAADMWIERAIAGGKEKDPTPRPFRARYFGK